MIEWVLQDFASAYGLRVVSLRYFNPIGADPQMRTGLAVADPSHVLGKLAQAYANRVSFSLTGVDWPTRDGSGIRDYSTSGTWPARTWPACGTSTGSSRPLARATR